MTLENQVCSLPLAQRLKELGVKQESVFSWSAREGVDGIIKEDAWHITTTPFRDDIPSFHSEDCDEHIAAFTVSELLKILDEMDTAWSFDHSHKAEEVADDLAAKIITMYELKLT